MKRLTFVKCPKQWGMGKHPTIYTSHKTFQEVVDRLAAYEDTGLEPEQVKDNMEMFKAYQSVCAGMPPEYIAELLELSKARAEGRLVVLPCKVGDTVFGICRYGRCAPFVAEGLVKEMYFANEDMRMCIVAKGFRGEWGKVIFGTREEAERALEGGADHA